jgi:hypothetical protein
VAIHDYTECVEVLCVRIDFRVTQTDLIHGSGYDSYMPAAINQAKAAGKKLIVEEWGSLVGSGRTANLNSNVRALS